MIPRQHVNTMAWTIAGLAVVSVLGATAFVYSGIYDMRADMPHMSVVTHMVETLRSRSLARQARDVAVPNLEDPAVILKGAGQYAAMCVGCHSAPGVPDTDVRHGLYPQPPLLHEAHFDPRESFVAIKHGIKMSGMPAWGGGDHGDDTIWSLVAFINKLPGMTADQYKDIVRRAPPDEEMSGMMKPGASESGHSKARHE